MLGLGNAIPTGSSSDTLLGAYYSNFVSGAGSWAKYSVDQGDLTITSNETIDSTGGWFKGVYTETQTSSSGITRNNIIVPADEKSGDYYKVSFKIYLGGTDWDGSDDVTVYHTYGGQGINSAVAQDDTVLYSGEATISSGSYANLTNIYVLTSSDYPQADSFIAIKDYKLELYRPAGN